MNNDEPGLVKVSVIQTKPRRRDREYNVIRTVEMVQKEAEAEKPHVILIPNYYFQQGLLPVKGYATKTFAKIAELHDLYIIGGMAEKREEDVKDGEEEKKGYNTGFIVKPDGSVEVFQRKLHMIPMECRRLEGGSDFSLIETDFGKIGCVMCNDIFYPEVARCLALMGAEIIFVPSIVGGTGVNALEVAARARAIENQVYLVNANAVPSEVADEFPHLRFGESGIYSPFLDNIDMARAGKGEEVIRVILDLDDLRELKKFTLDAANLSELAKGKPFNMLAGRKPGLYKNITKPINSLGNVKEGY